MNLGMKFLVLSEVFLGVNADVLFNASIEVKSPSLLTLTPNLDKTAEAPFESREKLDSDAGLTPLLGSKVDPEN
ncbi:unnamed protein product [[Candida] boidinii]|nr:unnamed protein product [[Candida] boidinii]